MLPNVEHGGDFALHVPSPGEPEDLSDALEDIWVMSVPFKFARGVAGFCILSDPRVSVLVSRLEKGTRLKDERPSLPLTLESKVASKWRMEQLKEQHRDERREMFTK